MSLPQGAVAPDPDAALMDRRILAFRPPCLVAAMEGVGRAWLSLPEASILQAEPVPAEQLVQFHFSGLKGVESCSLGGQELGAMLIAYCIGARVPLPARAASKTVSVTHWGVVLDFVIAFTAPPRWERPSGMLRRVKGEWTGR